MPFLFICEWFNLISFDLFSCVKFLWWWQYTSQSALHLHPPQHSSTSCTNHFSAKIVYFNLFCIFCTRKKRKKVWQQWKSFFVRKRIKEHSPKSALLLIQATSCGNWSMTSHPCCSKFLVNHKNYNFLDCDWFKKTGLFSTNSLSKLLLDSLLPDSSINQSHKKL